MMTEKNFENLLETIQNSHTTVDDMNKEFASAELNEKSTGLIPVLVFNEDKNKYEDATFQFIGEWRVCRTYDKDGRIETESKSRSYFGRKYQVWDIDDSVCMIFDSDVKFKTRLENYRKIIEYSNEFYKKEIQERKKIYKEIIHHCEAILSNEEVYLIICNYIEKFPIEMFVSPPVLAEFDRILEIDYHYDEEFLLSDGLSRTIVSKVKEVKTTQRISEMISSESISYQIISNNNDTLKRYIREELEYLKKYVEEKLDLPQNDLFILVYTLVHTCAQIKLANEFDRTNNEYFTTDSFSSIDRAVVDYLNCDTIDANNVYNDFKFVCYLIRNTSVFRERNYIECFNCFKNMKNEIAEKMKQDKFIENLTNSKAKENVEVIDINDIDLMTGKEFEYFIAKLFKQLGYDTLITKQSGDQGIDVIAEKDKRKIGIQVKCYSGHVGNSAIQEVIAGKTFYKLDKAMVITNSYFTNAAKELAYSADVILWDRDILKDKL
ncbi:MAG: restriction endonuclease [Eubacteriales bacterium]